MRFLDIVFSSIGLLTLSPLLILIYLLGLFDTGHPLFFQKRIGIKQKTFVIVKFRTMKLNTLSSGTHLVDPSKITFLGNFLRKTKLDELPQLWNVLVGSMSLVGPRPCLLNQKRLIIERKKRGVFRAKPGITGLSQVLDITMKNPKLLAKTDAKMLKNMTFIHYLYYIFITIFPFLKKKG